MKRQHPYSPKCRCTRCKAVLKLVESSGKIKTRFVLVHWPVTQVLLLKHTS